MKSPVLKLSIQPAVQSAVRKPSGHNYEFSLSFDRPETP